MTNTNDNKVGSACMCSTLTTTSVLSKFTALQIFQDALLQRQSFVDGGNDGDDRKEGVGGWKRGKVKMWRNKRLNPLGQETQECVVLVF